MVPLIERMDYLSQISESPKLRAFRDLINFKSVIVPSTEDLIEVDEIYYGLVLSLSKDDKKTFEEFLSRKSKSKPTKESPSVNDDFLIFTILVGVVRFKLDSTWIEHVVSVRAQNILTLTFSNILKKNYLSSENSPEVLVVFAKMVDWSMLTSEFINRAYREISTRDTIGESPNDFIIISCLAAFDQILLLKQGTEGGRVSQLISFENQFFTRTRYISWAIEMILFLGFLYGLFKLPIYSPKTVEVLNNYGYIFTILGALGITILGNQIQAFSKFSHGWIMRLFGYPKSLSFENK
jgi:hypothetical protein